MIGMKKFFLKWGRPGEGGGPEIRTLADEGGGGSKVGKNLRTSFMDGPIGTPDCPYFEFRYENFENYVLCNIACAPLNDITLIFSPAGIFPLYPIQCFQYFLLFYCDAIIK